MRARPRAKPSRLAALALAAVLVPALGGCGSSAPATDGPLSSGATESSIPHGYYCTPARAGQPIAFGQETFENYGHTTVVLDRVVLQKPHNERLIGAYAIKGGTGFIGIVHWPATESGETSLWKLRKPVHNFRLAPGQDFNMVLGVVATSAGQGRSGGMLVYYHDPAGNYVARDDIAMIIAVNKRSC